MHLILTKTPKTLFESLGTLCLCSAIVMNLAVSELPPFPCQCHNISFRYQSFQKEKPRFAKKPMFGMFDSILLTLAVPVIVEKWFLKFLLKTT